MHADKIIMKRNQYRSEWLTEIFCDAL